MTSHHAPDQLAGKRELATDVPRQGRLGFVPARFGPGIAGGAEIVLRQLAGRLAARGWDVEILTSCALDHLTWDNVLAPGESTEDGLRVRRFPTVRSTAGHERAALEAAILRGERLPLAQQQRWMNDGVRMPALYHYLLDRAASYRALVFTPYMFWPAYACAQVAPDRSLLWTCLHDEPFAYLELFQPVLSGSAGLFFQTEPEHALGHRLVSRLAPHALVGCGVEVPASYDAEGFRDRYGVDRPFVLYAGRREGAKGWAEMLAAFASAVTRRGLPFALVTMGVGPVEAPASIRDRVIDVGFLSDRDRDAAFAAATAYLQPSRYEAFSRTIMEAWLAGTPVVGNRRSAVVTHHVERSGAGLLYDDDAEFEECLVYLADSPETARELGAAGRGYVLANYQWDDVLDRVESAIAQWTTGTCGS